MDKHTRKKKLVFTSQQQIFSNLITTSSYSTDSCNFSHTRYVPSNVEVETETLKLKIICCLSQEAKNQVAGKADTSLEILVHKQQMHHFLTKRFLDTCQCKKNIQEHHIIILVLLTQKWMHTSVKKKKCSTSLQSQLQHC